MGVVGRVQNSGLGGSEGKTQTFPDFGCLKCLDLRMYSRTFDKEFLSYPFFREKCILVPYQKGDVKMSAVIPVLGKALGIGLALGAGGAMVVGGNAKGPVFLLFTIATVAIRAFAWYAGVGAAVGAGIGIVLSMCISQNNTSWGSLAGGAIFGGAIGYLIESGSLGMSQGLIIH